ncbi:MAG: exodeoxyribonuclease VII large subunit [Bacteroidetes bacterium]|nr:exodeoxyribonuclease VII large subunit [Bacteroidota bacterium]MBU1114636.1 exodeoxyribonuclease VII large subunit [Bacteroidota bacterium]MBU1798180.1 exodeoxyribonuclease VII large subunit [Bacteroidota bacterium]
MDLFKQEENIYSVSQITNSVKRLLENSFGNVKVVGEISNFKAHFSGHWYFTLKDATAQISCTMWKSANAKVRFTPEDGMKIIVSGNMSVYPPRGTYQVDVRSMQADGVGELQAAFERLKNRLAEEGLFDESLKKSIPQIPQKIGIVTAIDSAAFKDMVSVAQRRFPLVELIVASSRVQGEGAAENIAKNIKILDKRGDLDLIIIGRGGGSLEDLWAFNEEIVARTIFEAKTPIISGVGHEIDFTIADFVADLRAPTPTASMELATPNKEDILNYLENYIEESSTNISSIISSFKDKISDLIISYGFKSHNFILNNNIQSLDNYLFKIENGLGKKFQNKMNELELKRNIIESFNIDKILKRGFSLVKQDDKIVARGENFDFTKKTKIKFYDKEIEIK